MLLNKHFTQTFLRPPCAFFHVPAKKRLPTVISLKLCRNTLIRFFVVLVIISSVLNLPAYCQESEDSQVFISGFNAYQQKDYATTIAKMHEVLQKYPDSPLRDMVLFWLARSYFKNGNQMEAARYMSQFSKEYPDNPLKGTVDEELLALTARYDKGEKLPTGSLPATAKDRQLVVRKAEVEKTRFARENLEKAQLAKDQAERERVAAAKAETERIAAEAETVRLAAARKEQERKVEAKVEAERLAQEKAASAKRAAAEAEQQKLALLKKEQERLAAERAEKERLAVVAAAEVSLRASIKQEQLQRQTEKAVTVGEIAKPVPARMDGQRHVQQSKTGGKARAAKAALREKAIAQYKSILDNYPASKAAATAAAKLKELGVAVALPQPAAVEQLPENAQILHLEVAQFAGLEFNLTAKPQAYKVAHRISIPFEITNRGNGSDSFSLESGFPAEFATGFAAAAQPEQAVNQTTVLAPGESFKGVINLVIPPASIDGLRISYPVKAASRQLPEATQSREVTITAAAPLLRAIVKTDKLQLLPGEKTVYLVTVLNVGSTAAQDITLRLNLPPQLEAVDYAATGLRQEMKVALVLDGLQIKSGESREFRLTFQLKEDSLAGQELLIRAELVNNPLKTSAVFVSNAAYVQQQHGVLVRTASERQVVIPGQALLVPFVVTNTGNVREKFRISPSIKGAQESTIFQDLNRDGSRQANEPLITEVGPLAPQEEASIVMEIKTLRSASDGSQGSAQIVFSSEGDASRSSSGDVQFVYSRPVLQMAMTGRDGRLKPGEVASFDLAITNRGSNLARIVELQSVWPEQLELVAADPATNSVSNGTILWKFKELGTGEKRVINVSFRVKPGTGMGTNIQVKNILTYEDQFGSRY
jgi:uncharacterized protein DUF11/outer membrane lipoprotein YfiO